MQMKDPILLTMDIRDLDKDGYDTQTVVLFDRFRQLMKANVPIELVEVTDFIMDADEGVMTQYNLRVQVNAQPYLITLTQWGNAEFAMAMMRYTYCIKSKELIHEHIRKVAADHA